MPPHAPMPQFASIPVDPAMLHASVAGGAHTSLAAARVEAPRAVVQAMRESHAWRLAKHVLQLGLIAAVVNFVLNGGQQPEAALALAALGLVGILGFAVVDRRRFDAAAFVYERPQVVDVVAPVAVQQVVDPAAQLAALQRQLAAHVTHLDVT